MPKYEHKSFPLCMAVRVKYMFLSVGMNITGFFVTFITVYIVVLHCSALIIQ